MKTMKILGFKQYIKEQKLGSEETTLDPDFVEKKQKADQQKEVKIEKPTQDIKKKAERTLDKDVHNVPETEE